MVSEITRNEWGIVEHDPASRVLTLRWLESTSRMGDAGFRDSLTMLAEAAATLAPPVRVLIDARLFTHEFGPGVMEWRDSTIIPRYNAAGVTAFAFLMPAGFPGAMEAGGDTAVEGPAAYPTAWFNSLDGAAAWLAAH